MEKYRLLKKCGTSVSEALRKLTVKKRDGSMVNVRVLDLPDDRFEDFMDFNMEYFVKHELTHRAAGIPKNVNAMTEYRQYFTSIYKNNTSYVKNIWCPEQNGIISPQIIGISVVRLIKTGESLDYDTTQLKTKEVKNFFDISGRLDDLCAVPDIITANGVEAFYDDLGFAVHPDYYGTGLTNNCATFRLYICKTKGVPMTGAWLTAPASVKACANSGWVTVYEISYEELSKNLGVTLENQPQKCCYMIAKV